MCRVGAVEDPTLGGADLSTTIGRATGSAGFDENGKPIYRNKFSVCICINLIKIFNLNGMNSS